MATWTEELEELSDGETIIIRRCLGPHIAITRMMEVPGEVTRKEVTNIVSLSDIKKCKFDLFSTVVEKQRNELRKFVTENASPDRPPVS